MKTEQNIEARAAEHVANTTPVKPAAQAAFAADTLIVEDKSQPLPDLKSIGLDGGYSFVAHASGRYLTFR